MNPNNNNNYDPFSDPMLGYNQFRPDIQPDFYMNKELMTDDYANKRKLAIESYGWDKSTENGFCNFLDYLSSYSVTLSNYDKSEAVQQYYDLLVKLYKGILLWNRVDTNSPEFLFEKDLAVSYLRDKLSRTKGIDRERILQHPNRTLIDQKVQHQLSDGRAPEKRSWTDRFKRKQNFEE
jgi:hypothetical protein